MRPHLGHCFESIARYSENIELAAVFETDSALLAMHAEKCRALGFGSEEMLKKRTARPSRTLHAEWPST